MEISIFCLLPSRSNAHDPKTKSLEKIYPNMSYLLHSHCIPYNYSSFHRIVPHKQDERT